jgi:hypothetical protein
MRWLERISGRVRRGFNISRTHRRAREGHLRSYLVFETRRTDALIYSSPATSRRRRRA